MKLSARLRLSIDEQSEQTASSCRSSPICSFKTKLSFVIRLRSTPSVSPTAFVQLNPTAYSFQLSRIMANIENFDEDLFINVMNTHECIWNYKSEMYSDRIMKYSAWAAVCETFVPEFNTKTAQEKNRIAKTLQKKWKVLRDGFNRYVNKSKKTKSGSGARQTRKYIYFHQMSFLLPLTEVKAETVNSLEEETDTKSVVITEKQQRGRKRGSAAKEDNLIKQLSANINETYKENSSNHQADDDKLFLLSLHGDFKKISDEYKLDAKTEMLKVIKKYKLLSS